MLGTIVLGLGGPVFLGRNSTVFQSEVVAILAGVRNPINDGIFGRRKDIFSDSRVTLLSISRYNSRFSLVLEFRKIIEMVSFNCEITRHWVLDTWVLRYSGYRGGGGSPCSNKGED